MFAFLEKLDQKLMPIKIDIDSAIVMKSGAFIVAVQTLIEQLLKYVNDRESIIEGENLTIGNFLENESFMRFLQEEVGYREKELLNQINLYANGYKHYGETIFNEKEVKSFYKTVYTFSRKIYNFYIKPSIDYQYDKSFIEELLLNTVSINKIYDAIELKKRVDKPQGKVRCKTAKSCASRPRGLLNQEKIKLKEYTLAKSIVLFSADNGRCLSIKQMSASEIANWR